MFGVRFHGAITRRDLEALRMAVDAVADEHPRSYRRLMPSALNRVPERCNKKAPGVRPTRSRNSAMRCGRLRRRDHCSASIALVL